jgi:hypothetical protein
MNRMNRRPSDLRSESNEKWSKCRDRASTCRFFYTCNVGLRTKILREMKDWSSHGVAPPTKLESARFLSSVTHISVSFTQNPFSAIVIPILAQP